MAARLRLAKNLILRIGVHGKGAFKAVFECERLDGEMMRTSWQHKVLFIELLSLFSLPLLPRYLLEHPLIASPNRCNSRRDSWPT